MADTQERGAGVAKGSEALQSGLRFGGGFTLLRRIGAGGMGEVWLAREESPRREVALKILRVPFGEDTAGDSDAASARRRFQREAAILASCDHPSIIPVYAYGIDDGTGLPWYSMKSCLLDAGDVRHVCAEVLHCQPPDLSARGGEPLPLSLADILKAGSPLPEKTVAEIGKALVSAVSYAHSLPEPVVHRDIKPANILFSAEGKVVVTDFGVAKRLDADGIAQTTSSERRGLFVGTFAYAAPELQHGGRATAASDYYGIGAVLYEALTLQRPNSLQAPSEFGPRRVSRRWDTLLGRMLASDPDRRLSNPTEVTAELDAIAAGGRSAKRMATAVAALVAIAAAAILAFVRCGAGAHATRAGTGLETAPPPASPVEENAPGTEANQGGADAAGGQTAAREQGPMPERDGATADAPREYTMDDLREFLLADRATFGGRHLSEEQRARRAGEVRGIALPGGLSMDFAWCRNTELGRDIYDFTHYDDSVPIPDIEPSRIVLVTNFCYIGRTEVTVAQWNAVMGGGAEGEPGRPVLCSFRDAERFVRAMNALPAASNVVFRIPTEMEWEHGCRGISLCYFSHKNPDDVSWNAANSGGELHDAGLKKSVGYGLFDMHGNAPEWCADAFAPLGEGPLVNPFRAPETGEEDRVVRGGSFADMVAEMLAEPRRGLPPETGRAGFRLAMSEK